jgi:hypothetical protein
VTGHGAREGNLRRGGRGARTSARSATILSVTVRAISRHAAERYVERCKPHLTVDQAKTELRALIDLSPPMVGIQDRPRWVGPIPPLKNKVGLVAGYVIVADSLALPVSGDGHVITLLERGGDKPERVQRRREGRRRRRAYLRSKSNGHPATNVRGKRPTVAFDG